MYDNIITESWETSNTKHERKNMNKNVEAVIRQIVGASFCKVSYTNKTHDLRKGATDGSGSVNPYWSEQKEIVRKVENAEINLGVQYPSAVEGRLSRIDGCIDPDEYEYAETPYESCNPPHKCLCQHKGTKEVFVRYMPVKSGLVSYWLNDQDITENVRQFIAKKVECKKQTDAGLVGKDQVKWRTLSLNSVNRLEIKQLGVVVE